MKLQFVCCLLAASLFSCTNSDNTAGREAPSQKEGAAGNGEKKDGISDYSGNKKSFMLTCNIDGRLALGGDNATDEQVTQFCECAWEKTGGEYPGDVMANNSKLEKHPVLKQCFEDARTK